MADTNIEGAKLTGVLRLYQDGEHQTGEQFWQQAQTLWSWAWPANHETLKLLQRHLRPYGVDGDCADHVRAAARGGGSAWQLLYLVVCARRLARARTKSRDA